jgi:hypothetical protein
MTQMSVTSTIKYFFTIFLIINTIGCLPTIEDCDPKELKIAFASDSAQFKKEVFESMPSYIQLKNFIIKNLPAILSHNDKKCQLEIVHADGTKDTTECENSSYAFYDYGKGNEIKDQVPENLYPELKKIYQNFNKNNFDAVHFDRDSSITIAITNPSEYNEKNIGIKHFIKWTNHKYTKIGDSSSLSRDTLLNGAIYTIFIDCYSGI